MTKKYRVIAKVNNKDFKKWSVNDLIRFTNFLDVNYKDWRFFNVYQYISNDGKGKQLANFTNKSRPMKKNI